VLEKISMKLLDVLPLSPRLRRIALVLLLLAGLGFLLICAAAVGYWGGKNNTLEKVNEKIVQPALARFETPPVEEVVTWETINTHFFPASDCPLQSLTGCQSSRMGTGGD
jgi:hypothetical protein